MRCISVKFQLIYFFRLFCRYSCRWFVVREYIFVCLLSCAKNLARLKIKVTFVFRRTTSGVDRVCTLWRSAGIPEKEPWTEWHLLRRPGYQTTNEPDVTTADEVCLANRWWHELPVFTICMWHIIYYPSPALSNIRRQTSSQQEFNFIGEGNNLLKVEFRGKEINYW